MTRRGLRGMGIVYTRGTIWWVQYCYRGKVHRESSGSPNRAHAVQLLRRRLEEIGRGRLVGPIIERTSFEDLVAILLNDYRINRRKSYDRIEDAVNHLR